jgi:cobalt-zinc-cadmium efflux system membrane fusion protein
VGTVLLAAALLAAWTGRFAPRAGLRAEEAKKAGPELVSGEPDAVRLPAETVGKLGIATGAARPRGAARPGELVLTGSLVLDAAGVARVRLTLPATVVEVPDIAPGTRVKKGQLLAALQSLDVAAKKSELVDSVIQLQLDREVLDRAEKAWKEGAIPETFLLNARRHLQTSTSAVNRAERALLVWKIPEADVQALREYAEKAIPPKGKRDPEKEKAWSRVEVRAPRDGVVFEKNVGGGDLPAEDVKIVFTIADVSRLEVLVTVPEHELPALVALSPENRRWSIRVVGHAPVDGVIEGIGTVIDPNDHTATLKGTLPNPDGRLRAGQFVTAVIQLPASAREVVVPASALVDTGRETFVFVQPDAAKPVYVQRPVTVVRRGHDAAHVRFSSKPDERIVTAGAIELKAVLDDLKAAQK